MRFNALETHQEIVLVGGYGNTSGHREVIHQIIGTYQILKFMLFGPFKVQLPERSNFSWMSSYFKEVKLILIQFKEDLKLSSLRATCPQHVACNLIKETSGT